MFSFFVKLQRHKCYKYCSYCVLSEVPISQHSKRSPCSHWNTWNNLWETGGIAYVNNMYVLQTVILSAFLITQYWSLIWMSLTVIRACFESQCCSAAGYLMSGFVNYVPKPQRWYREYVAHRAHNSQQQTKEPLKNVSSSVQAGLQEGFYQRRGLIVHLPSF